VSRANGRKGAVESRRSLHYVYKVKGMGTSLGDVVEQVKPATTSIRVSRGR